MTSKTAKKKLVKKKSVPKKKSVTKKKPIKKKTTDKKKVPTKNKMMATINKYIDVDTAMDIYDLANKYGPKVWDLVASYISDLF